MFSGLGQPLRAEIEVTATREELADMKAQLASPEVFKQAGLDYATTLLSIRFNLEKRPNGQAIIKLTSDRPINDPFVDMLMELNWPSGRLVREYTFLLDPPEYAAKAPASVAPAAVVSAPAAAAPGSSAIDNDVRARASAQVRAQQQSAPQRPADPSLRTGEGREVRRGETLHRIASETKPEGVSLEQMLVGLFRANPDAFDGGNMNRLRAGAIMSIPEKSAVESVSPAEARKVVLAQSSDWNAYRSKLAGAAARTPAKEDAASQEAAGKITAKVDDKGEEAQPKDQLKVSRTEQAGKKGGAAARGPSQEDMIAKDRALKEANERNAALEKSVADLQKLLALKDPGMAELEKKASPKPEVAAPAAKPAEPPKPVEPPAAAQPTTPPEAQQTTPTAPTPEAAPPKVETPPPAPQTSETPAPPAVKSEAPKPAEKPKVAAPPPPPEEPGFFDDLLDNPMALAGGGGILALLAAYLVVRRRRAAAEVPEQDLSSTLTPPSTTSLTANSVFRSTGGQSVDTASQTPAQTDFSQAGPGSIDTDEVDPVAEADVYMAYGRDAQAEEILLEARQKDPKRLAITLKLLEIYSGRKDVKQFEALATELYGETGGAGPDWEKAATMGRLLDPDNPLYRGAASASAAPAAAAALAAGAAIAAGAKDRGDDGQAAASVAAVDEAADLTSLDFDLGEPESKPAPQPIEVVAEQEPKDAEPLDFDLGSSEPAGAAVPSRAPASDFSLPEISFPGEAKTAKPEEPAARMEVPELDFDIGTKVSPVVEQLDRQEAAAQVRDLDFDLGAIDLSAPAPIKPAALPEASVNEPGSDGVEFDVSLTESTFLGRSATEPPSFDMSSIDLDLQSPPLEIPGEKAKPASAAAPAQQAMSEDLAFEEVQVSTAVNADFGVDQMETQVTPPGFATTQGETAVNPDFGLDQMETLVTPGMSMPRADTAGVAERDTDPAATVVSPSLGTPMGMEPDLDISASEEVATKLDLAKAYEEMGDLEGARELLQEVLKEGDANQRESAQNLLAKIGG